MQDKGLYIGQLAKLAGVGTQTIRYYEREGLLGKPTRTGAGYRLYPSETATRVRFIKKAQSLGLSLDEIREILRLARRGQSPCGCVRKTLQEHLKEIDRRIHAMQQFRAELAEQLGTLADLPDAFDTSAHICQLIETISLGSPPPEPPKAIKRKESRDGKAGRS